MLPLSDPLRPWRRGGVRRRRRRQRRSILGGHPLLGFRSSTWRSASKALAFRGRAGAGRVGKPERERRRQSCAAFSTRRSARQPNCQSGDHHPGRGRAPALPRIACTASRWRRPVPRARPVDLDDVPLYCRPDGSLSGRPARDPLIEAVGDAAATASTTPPTGGLSRHARGRQQWHRGAGFRSRATGVRHSRAARLGDSAVRGDHPCAPGEPPSTTRWAATLRVGIVNVSVEEMNPRTLTCPFAFW
jgi:hypothetical protein